MGFYVISAYERLFRTKMFSSWLQCPLDITTLDKAAALPIATSNPATNLRQYINSDLGYNDLKFQLLCSKIATVNSFEVVISNGLSFYRLHITFLNQMAYGNSDRAVYSDLNPLDGGQSLYPMSTVLFLARQSNVLNGNEVHFLWHCN